MPRLRAALTNAILAHDQSGATTNRPHTRDLVLLSDVSFFAAITSFARDSSCSIHVYNGAPRSAPPRLSPDPTSSKYIDHQPRQRTPASSIPSATRLWNPQYAHFHLADRLVMIMDVDDDFSFDKKAASDGGNPMWTSGRR